MPVILDAHALMVYLQREPGFETVKSLFIRSLENNTPLRMTSVNLGEVLYIVMRERGSAQAEEIERIVHNLPIHIVDVDLSITRQANIHIVDVDLSITRQAARFKARKKMSYADCFAAALAKIHQADLVTGDPEFKEVEGEITVRWI